MITFEALIKKSVDKEYHREYNRKYKTILCKKRRATPVFQGFLKVPQMTYAKVPAVNEETLEVIDEYCEVCHRQLSFREKLFGKRCINHSKS